MQSMKVYHDLYCLSATGLGWDAMPKMTKIEIKLIPGRDMYIFFEKCV